jgi:hypothetical protein
LSDDLLLVSEIFFPSPTDIKLPAYYFAFLKLRPRFYIYEKEFEEFLEET